MLCATVVMRLTMNEWSTDCKSAFCMRPIGFSTEPKWVGRRLRKVDHSSAHPQYLERSTLMTAQNFRRIALSLPEATECSHMDHPDFRVGGKIFATLGYPDARCGMVKLPPRQTRIVQSNLSRCICAGERRLGKERRDASSLGKR